MIGYIYIYIYVCVCVFLLSAGNVRLCKVDTTNIYTIYYDIYIYTGCVYTGICMHEQAKRHPKRQWTLKAPHPNSMAVSGTWMNVIHCTCEGVSLHGLTYRRSSPCTSPSRWHSDRMKPCWHGVNTGRSSARRTWLDPQEWLISGNQIGNGKSTLYRLCSH